MQTSAASKRNAALDGAARASLRHPPSAHTEECVPESTCYSIHPSGWRALRQDDALPPPGYGTAEKPDSKKPFTISPPQITTEQLSSARILLAIRRSEIGRRPRDHATTHPFTDHARNTSHCGAAETATVKSARRERTKKWLKHQSAARRTKNCSKSPPRLGFCRPSAATRETCPRPRIAQPPNDEHNNCRCSCHWPCRASAPPLPDRRGGWGLCKETIERESAYEINARREGSASGAAAK